MVLIVAAGIKVVTHEGQVWRRAPVGVFMTGNTKTGAAGLITPMSYVIGQCGLLSQSVACRGLEFAEWQVTEPYGGSGRAGKTTLASVGVKKIKKFAIIIVSARK